MGQHSPQTQSYKSRRTSHNMAGLTGRMPKLILFISLLSFIERDFWKVSATLDSTETYPHVLSLTGEEQDDYVLFWKTTRKTVTFEIHVKTLGYVGFGISPSGGMAGSDVTIGGVKDGQVYFKDRHANGLYTPEIDSSQDYELLDAREYQGYTILKFSRKLKTCDQHKDLPINLDSETYVIWSYHPDDPDSETLLPYHTHRGSKLISWSGTRIAMERPRPELPNDAFPLDILAQNFTIPAQETTYYCHAFPLSQLEEEAPLNVVWLERILTNDSYLHHLLFLGCTEQALELEGQCYHSLTYPGCSTILTGFAASTPFYMADDFGYPLDDEIQVLLIAIHYNNPLLETGKIDSSGVRMWLTSTPQHEPSHSIPKQLIIGVRVTPVVFIPPHQERFTLLGQCVPECLQSAMEAAGIEEIHLMSVFLHAHTTATAIYVRHFRGDQELPPVITKPHFNFNSQVISVLQQEVTVRKGDRLVAECVFNTTRRHNITVLGYETRDEMCGAVIRYYPGLPINMCMSYPTPTQIIGMPVEFDPTDDHHSLSDLYVTGNSLYSVRPMSYLDYITNHVTWSDLGNVARLQHAVTGGHTYPFCQVTPEDHYPISRQDISLSHIEVTAAEEPEEEGDNCDTAESRRDVEKMQKRTSWPRLLRQLFRL